MENQTSPKQRGSKNRWLDAAYELLISDGISAVKVMPLAKQLNLTRTGFYWFFDNLDELHDAMIERWESKNTGNLIAQCDADAATITEALFNLMDCWLDTTLFDAKLDLAIRNWARIAPDLQQKLDHVDTARIRAVTEMFTRFGYTPEQAEVRGMTVIYTQIGYISMDISEHPDERLARVQHYVELFASTAPTAAEIERFEQRHLTKFQ